MTDEPTELEIHRADYQACNDAGFECPGELLSAYRTLEADNAALREALEVLSDLADHFNVSGVYFTEDDANRAALEAAEHALAPDTHAKPGPWDDLNMEVAR